MPTDHSAHSRRTHGVDDRSVEPVGSGVSGVAEQLDGLANLSLGDQADAFARIHAQLQEALAGIDDT